MRWFFRKIRKRESTVGPASESHEPRTEQPIENKETTQVSIKEDPKQSQFTVLNDENRIADFLSQLNQRQTAEDSESTMKEPASLAFSVPAKEVLKTYEPVIHAWVANNAAKDFLLDLYASRLKEVALQSQSMMRSKDGTADDQTPNVIFPSGRTGFLPGFQIGEATERIVSSSFLERSTNSSVSISPTLKTFPIFKDVPTVTTTRRTPTLIERFGANVSVDSMDQRGYSFEDALNSEKLPEKNSEPIEPKVEGLENTGAQEYFLQGRFAKARIIKEPNGQTVYTVTEIALSAQETDLLNEIEELLQDELQIDARNLGSNEKAELHLKDQVKSIAKRYKLRLPSETFENITYYIVRDFIYYGKIDPLMRDPYIEDISCNGPGLPIYIWHRDYESVPTNIVFTTPEELDKFVVKLTYMTRRAISIAQPMVDASLPDGSRLQVTYEKEITRRGSSFTIRKFRERPLTITELLLSGTVTPAVAAWCWFVIEKQASIIVVGGTASGKTTTINMLSTFIRPTAKIISIEDTAELQLHHENWLSSIVRTGTGVGSKTAEITLYDLLKNAMRQRPDYIIVGEVRGSEAYTLIQAIATGHGGLATLHADSVEAAIHRLESEPMNIPRSLVTTIDVVIVQGRVRRGDRSVRRVLSVAEIVGLDPGTKDLLTNEVFKWNAKTDAHDYLGRSYLIERIMKAHGLSYEQVKSDLERRRIVLEWLVSQNKTDFKEVVDVIRSFYLNSASLLKRIESENTEKNRTDTRIKEQVPIS